jgi:hypothetical protein
MVPSSCPRGPNASRPAQPLDLLDFPRIEVESEDLEVGPHVLGVGRARQRDHADVEGEPEDDLADGAAVALGDPGQLGAGQRRAVGGEQ